jgi:hypothetical protein
VREKNDDSDDAGEKREMMNALAGHTNHWAGVEDHCGHLWPLQAGFLDECFGGAHSLLSCCSSRVVSLIQLRFVGRDPVVRESEVEDRPAVAHILLRGAISQHYDAPFFLGRGRDLVVGRGEGDIVAAAYAVLKVHCVHEFAVRRTCSRKKGRSVRGGNS